MKYLLLFFPIWAQAMPFPLTVPAPPTTTIELKLPQVQEFDYSKYTTYLARGTYIVDGGNAFTVLAPLQELKQELAQNKVHDCRYFTRGEQAILLKYLNAMAVNIRNVGNVSALPTASQQERQAAQQMVAFYSQGKDYYICRPDGVRYNTR